MKAALTVMSAPMMVTTSRDPNTGGSQLTSSQPKAMSGRARCGFMTFAAIPIRMLA